MERHHWRGWATRILATALLAGTALAGEGAPANAQADMLHVPVLMYHRIRTPPPDARLPELWIAPRAFRAQLRILRDRGWRSITAEELTRAALAHRTVGPRRFVITVDDGARDGYHYAAPILQRLDMRATYCVVPGRIGRPWQLRRRHLVALHQAGHEIANHSLGHADLPALGQAPLRRQLARSRDLIERFVGEAPATLCYPYGHHDAGVRRVVARTGHLAAFTTAYGAAQPLSSRYRWPRIRVNGSDTPAELLARLAPYRRGGGATPFRVAAAQDLGGAVPAAFVAASTASTRIR